jgi:hypothetical protein
MAIYYSSVLIAIITVFPNTLISVLLLLLLLLLLFPLYIGSCRPSAAVDSAGTLLLLFPLYIGSCRPSAAVHSAGTA